MINLLIICIIVLTINIPFGYWRTHVKRFSLQWFLAIHIPVPFVIALRIFTDVGFVWYSYIFLVLAFYLGQKIGSIIHKRFEKVEEVSSCLVMDLYKLVTNR